MPKMQYLTATGQPGWWCMPVLREYDFCFIFTKMDNVTVNTLEHKPSHPVTSGQNPEAKLLDGGKLHFQ